MIEKVFDIPFIASLALREKRIQQNFRPIIGVHKWFARRPGSLFRGLLLSELADKPLSDVYFKSNRLSGYKVADPFMGGGTPLIEANRLGCDVEGYDINPMAYWIVKQEIEHLDLPSYIDAANTLRGDLEDRIGKYYRTACPLCGRKDAPVKYYLWIKTISCAQCEKPIDLFPGYLLATDSRHPNNVFVCPQCGSLNEAAKRDAPGRCTSCSAELRAEGPARRGKCACPSCDRINTFPDKTKGPPRHRLFAIEYHCPSCKTEHKGRFFKAPDEEDRAALERIDRDWKTARSRFVPDDEIPAGDETNRLHRWGYRYYREMFNSRQLLGLELSARLIEKVSGPRIKNALATNLSDLLRYQNMLCRYDSVALKSLDIFSVHGFPVGLVQCESNLLGIRTNGKYGCIGSGGWANIVEKFIKAKSYCDNPFEIKYYNNKKLTIPISDEWIGDIPGPDREGTNRVVKLYCKDAGAADIPPSSLDAVLTDPPYFGNVQYAELMDFCYVWLRRLVGTGDKTFAKTSTRDAQELTGNQQMGRGIDHFAQGMSAVFSNMAGALKPGAPLAFTYHHNELSAYAPITIAILDAGLTCTASIPCPAEMGASIHINGTGSSIIDTVFVCRSTGTVFQKSLADTKEDIAKLASEDAAKLREGGVTPTPGDLRCVIFGHLARLAIWSLRDRWDNAIPIRAKIDLVKERLSYFGNWKDIAELVNIEDHYELTPLFASTGPDNGAGYAETHLK